MTYKLKDPTLTATPIEDVVTRQLESAKPADIAVFLQEAFESGDTKHFVRCVGIAAKAVGMIEMAQRTGMKRPALYRLTDGHSKPRLDTIMTVVDALGVKMKLVA